MALLVDSKAVFSEQAKLYGLAEFIPKLAEKGWDTFGNLAFCTTCIPGQGGDSKLSRDLITPVLGSAEHPQAAALRRLHFEARTIAAADLRRRVERADADPPRRLPNAEKEERRKVVADRLGPGLRLEGNLDPSYGLIDLATGFYEDDRLQYIPWEDCNTLNQEVEGTRKVKVWKPDHAGLIREILVDEVAATADISTDLLLKQTLQRRGLALEMGDVLSFDMHEKLVDLLIGEYQRGPPPGYTRVSIEQLARADREVFKHLVSKTRSGIRRNLEGGRPLDVLFEATLQLSKVTLLLAPLQGAPGGSGKKRPREGDAPGPAGKGRSARRTAARNQRVEELKAEAAAAKAAAAAARAPHGAKAAAKGSNGPGMPRELIGECARTSDNRPICFNYNWGKCDQKVKPGQSCSRGVHVCCKNVGNRAVCGVLLHPRLDAANRGQRYASINKPGGRCREHASVDCIFLFASRFGHYVLLFLVSCNLANWDCYVADAFRFDVRSRSFDRFGDWAHHGFDAFTSPIGAPSLDGQIGAASKRRKASNPAGDNCSRVPSAPTRATTRMVAVETFARSANLTAKLELQGFDAFGVDREANRHVPKAGIIAIDLSTPSGAQLFFTVISDPSVVYVHFCVPSDTLSRARESSYSADNPLSSILWAIPGFRDLLIADDTVATSFQVCARGGTRDMWMRLLANFGEISALAAVCPKNHKRAPWGPACRIDTFTSFRAVHEAEYPDLLRERWAAVISLAAAAMGARADLKAFTSDQPRRDPFQLISECKTVFVVRADLTRDKIWLAANKGPIQEGHNLAGRLLPRGAKILQVRGLAAAGATFGNLDDTEDAPRQGAALPPTHTRGPVIVQVGIPWTPFEFFQKAKEIEPPWGRRSAPPHRLCAPVFRILTLGANEIIRSRRDRLDYWRSRAAALDEAEAALHAQAHAEVRPFLVGKRLLLLQEALEVVGFPSPGKLIGEVVAGVKLFGECPATGAFPLKKTEASASFDDLFRTSRWAQMTSPATARPSGDPEIDDVIFEKTRAECKAGWAVGPLSKEHLDEAHGPLWVPARRFGVRQGSDYRPIDDFSEFGHKRNGASATSEKIDPGGVDEIAAMARALLSSVDWDTGRVELKPRDGPPMVGRVHAGWTPEYLCRLIGRSSDLWKAFKQLARRPSFAAFSIVAAWNPRSNAPELRELRVCPFGARNVVWGFNWLARGFEWALCYIFDLVATHYFDDFPQVEPALLATSAETTFKAFMGLLGWRLKGDDGKDVLFDVSFSTLGVVFDFARAHIDATFAVRNKGARIPEILRGLREAQVSGLRPGLAASLLGRLRCAGSNLFGRAGAVGLKLLSSMSARGGIQCDQSELRHLFAFWEFFFAHSKDRTARANFEAPLLIFSDGAVEGKEYMGATIGAAIWDPRDDSLEFFGRVVPHAWADRWEAGGADQVIAQAELYPAVVARHTWEQKIAGRPVIQFIDDDSTRMGLLRGFSPASASAGLIGMILQEDVRLE
ncbi:unnamed protein product, partial [Prorocentrum cordatum]